LTEIFDTKHSIIIGILKKIMIFVMKNNMFYAENNHLNQLEN